MLITIAILLLLSGSAVQEEAGKAELVGREMCVVCHEMTDPFLKTPHAPVECEVCHGPGSLHAESGGSEAIGSKGFSVSSLVTMCLSCHEEGAGHVTEYVRSPHGKNQVSCTDCHQIHQEQSNFGLLKEADVPLCTSCHQSAEAEFRQPYHHPVLEGGMSCLDCHSPHSDPEKSARRYEAFPKFGCVTCHVDKRGPFTFEHAPLAVNGCQECHKAHGSFNPMLLTRSRVHQLCLECHSFTPGVAGSQPPAFHDIRSARYQNCTVCHRTIHGSYTDPAFRR
jgi:DmsE family decaheme c-type cytochrome